MALFFDSSTQKKQQQTQRMRTLKQTKEEICYFLFLTVVSLVLSSLVGVKEEEKNKEQECEQHCIFSLLLTHDSSTSNTRFSTHCSHSPTPTYPPPPRGKDLL